MLQDIQIRRRALLKHALVLVGAAATTGISAEALAYGAKKPKRHLAKSAFATLSAACDTLIPATDTPGALAADRKSVV